jgi:hypothetical protein
MPREKHGKPAVGRRIATILLRCKAGDGLGEKQADSGDD